MSVLLKCPASQFAYAAYTLATHYPVVYYKSYNSQIMRLLPTSDVERREELVRSQLLSTVAGYALKGDRGEPEVHVKNHTI